MSRLLFLILLVLAARPAAAVTLEMNGAFTQGGIIMGRTDPGTELTLDGKPVRVSPDGIFVLGFGREAEPKAELVARGADGREQRRTLDVAKRDYKIQRIDGLPQKYVAPPADVLARIRRENAEIKRVRQIDTEHAYFAEGFIWPAKGRISGVYGSQRILNGEPKRPHYGVDVAAPAGTPVVAPAGGIVRLAERDLYYTGGTIILDHGHGLTSAFLHMQDVTVKVGQELKRGDPMGTIGSTGRSTGAHLDWRINWFDVRVDAAVLVPPMGE
ncbi:M23 family metallopeptidase [Nisaea acidiphila]|uniref:M23 family metallopeptidase n=1 Tax=Nisaea acidiphila TaxID=1862145 RepID=A0A9J7APH1_9PROT|nr:M23 family metallopeptidase [Nisaea acidiphila]UUX48236.1 M23 family metallopeptidase [Nisaea acidiphila]